MRSEFTVKRLLLLVFLAFTLQTSRAQLVPEPGLYTGLDVLKSVAVFGLVAEPNLRYITQKNWVLGLTYGYVNFRHDSVHYNLNYRNQGSYIKPGIEFLFPNSPFSVGVGYLFSSTKETGNVDFAGPYFGNKRLEMNRKIRTRGFELSASIHLKVSQRWLFSISSRVNFIRNRITDGNFREVPLYYLPGAGYVLDKTKSSRTTTGGISLAVSYRITGKSQPKPAPEITF